MASGLTKPKSKLFRSFLYLNGDEVLNALAGLEEGGIEEVLTRSAEEGGSELGGEIGVPAAKGKAGKKRSKRVEEEIRRKRTEHSAATTLYRRLHEEEAIGRLEETYGPEAHDELEEHMLLEFKAEIRVHPLHQVVAAARGWLEAAPQFGTSRQEIADIKETVKVLETMSGSGASGDRTFLVFAEAAGNAHADYRLILPIQERYLLVPLDEFVGRATFVTQVDRMLAEGDDDVLAVRLIRNAPQLALERQGLIEALPELISGIDELGIETSQGDFFLTYPSVILKPIFIFK
jgi:hypothetical protein